MWLRVYLKKIKILISFNFDKILHFVKIKSHLQEPVIFITEKNDWAIKFVGKNISNSINHKKPFFVKIISEPGYYKNKVVHFGSQYMWVDWFKILPKNNFYIVSFFHGKKEDGIQVEEHINRFLESIKYLSFIVVSSSIVKERLLKWGVPLKKICLIPIGVNTDHFRPTKILKKSIVRKQYGISKSELVIGSFQKDGIGWGEGNIPKLIKGPDIFIKVISLLKNKGFNVTVFLTGPARGYIKKELKKINVKYIHNYFENQNDLLNCYHALDFYLITSREEGGPMGLMESMASGVPVISTPVGMSVDLIKNNLSGKISSNFDHKEITKLIMDLIADTKLKNIIIKNALLTVGDVKWEIISKNHYNSIYSPLVKKLD